MYTIRASIAHRPIVAMAMLALATEISRIEESSIVLVLVKFEARISN